MGSGLLTIVGTGIKSISHITTETQAAIKKAEKLFFLMNEPATINWLQRLNPSAESLNHLYIAGQRRIDIYQNIVSHMLAPVRQGMQVCVVFYGHPGIYVTPSHAAIQQAQREGLRAQMLPGISAEDCLCADLAFDPASHGCQSFDATDFLVHRRHIDTSSHLILWQVGVTGDLFFRPGRVAHTGIRMLAAHLSNAYGAEHRAAIYEAAQYPSFNPRITWVTLSNLAEAPISTLSTLYVPPSSQAQWDRSMMRELGIQIEDILWEDAP